MNLIATPSSARSIKVGSTFVFIASIAAVMASLSTQSPTAAESVAGPEREGARSMLGLDVMCVGALPGVPLSLCFVPGTSAEEVNQVTQGLVAQWAQDLAERPAGEGDGGAAYYLGTRWALGGSSAQGAPVSLTWSMPADGLSVSDGLAGGAASPNNLNATFVTKFGSLEAGKSLIRQVFARWSELSGVTYIETADDNAAWGAAGSTTRGEIRIVGRTFGSTGVLAYTYYPNNGDMVFVTSNSNYWSTANNNRYFRNVCSHEHGHGLGIAHVCPDNGTKLMEPFITTAFDGPQPDDIRAVQRDYGDRNEPNDTVATASGVLAASGTTSVTNQAIDDNSDVDYFKFTATSGSTLSASLTPQGPSSYLSGPQNADGSCSAGTAVLPLAVHNLVLSVYTGTNTTPIIVRDVTAAGGYESISNLVLPTTGQYEIKVSSTLLTDDTQSYALVTSIVQAPVVVGDVDGNGRVDGADLGFILAVWGPVNCGSVYDITGDCIVDGADLGVLLSNWT